MSATASEQSETGESGAPTLGPGERLQAARIEQGLTVDDVANRMHLSIGILEALEENNFDEITAPIFVKGYLRAYARIVSLDEEEMIGLYTEYHRGEDPPISTINSVTPELSAGDARIRWTTYLVVLVLLTLLGAWWWNRQSTESTPISLDSQPGDEAVVEMPVAEPVIEAVTAPETPVEAAVSAPVSPVDAPAVEPGSATPAETRAQLAPQPIIAPSPNEPSTAPETAASVGEPAPGEADASLVAPADGEAPLAVGIETVTDAVEVAAPEVEAIDRAAPPQTRSLPGIIAPSGSDRLRLVVHADTWADIKDGEGFRLVYDLLRAGSSIELTGEAPFAVFLGNGHGIELQFNGEAIDFSADIRDNNTARLDIGE